LKKFSFHFFYNTGDRAEKHPNASVHAISAAFMYKLICMCFIIYNFIHHKVANNTKKIKQLKITTEKETKYYLSYIAHLHIVESVIILFNQSFIRHNIFVYSFALTGTTRLIRTYDSPK